MERFWAKVDKSPGHGPNGDCWLWTARIHPRGYGYFRDGAQMVKAHRKAYELSGKEIPPGAHVLHSCDIPACVNPAHLRAGSHTDNMRDKVARNRYAKTLRRSKHRDNTSGHVGVTRHGNGWRAFFEIEGKLSAKTFKTKAEAIALRRAWEETYLK